MFFNLFGPKHTCRREFNGLQKGDKFHFIAMGGVGQSALAKILIRRGYEVSGSDINDSKYLKELKSLGAKVYIGHNENNVPNDCFVVVSSAIKEDNPELIRAKELGLSVLHRSDLLCNIFYEFPLTTGFSGTHGKTTTSGLCSYVLSKMGKKPAFAVGGIIPELNTNADADRNSDTFVAELDESDGTIVKYSPDILVVNNLEADHLDFYKNGLDDVLKTFKKVTDNLPSGAKIIVNADDDGVLELLKIVNKDKDVLKFAILNTENNIDIFAKNIIFNDTGAEFDVIYKGENLGKISTSLKGMHNVYNALAVILALIVQGLKFREFAPHFKGFTGMGRRFQTVYKGDDIEIVDDYAHHPSEIKATLKAAYEYKIKTAKKRTVAIFQPHRYTRLKALFNEFLTSFDDCDILLVLDVFSAGDAHDFEFNSESFAKAMHNSNKDVIYIPGKISEITDDVLKYIKKDDLILTLGAGDITKLGSLLGEKFAQNG